MTWREPAKQSMRLYNATGSVKVKPANTLPHITKYWQPASTYWVAGTADEGHLDGAYTVQDFQGTPTPNPISGGAVAPGNWKHGTKTISYVLYCVAESHHTAKTALAKLLDILSRGDVTFCHNEQRWLYGGWLTAAPDVKWRNIGYSCVRVAFTLSFTDPLFYCIDIASYQHVKNFLEAAPRGEGGMAHSRDRDAFEVSTTGASKYFHSVSIDDVTLLDSPVFISVTGTRNATPDDAFNIHTQLQAIHTHWTYLDATVTPTVDVQGSQWQLILRADTLSGWWTADGKTTAFARQNLIYTNQEPRVTVDGYGSRMHSVHDGYGLDGTALENINTYVTVEKANAGITLSLGLPAAGLRL